LALRIKNNNFTNHCGTGFGLTVGLFRRRLLLLRGKIAVAAVALSAPKTRWRRCVVQVAIDPVETGYAGAKSCRARPGWNPGRRSLL